MYKIVIKPKNALITILNNKRLFNFLSCNLNDDKMYDKMDEYEKLLSKMNGLSGNKKNQKEFNELSKKMLELSAIINLYWLIKQIGSFDNIKIED